MPYEITWENRGAHKRMYGFVTSVEFLRAALEMQGHARFDELRYVVNDFREVTGHNITEADVMKVAAYALGAFHINPRIAIAAISTDAEIQRLMELYASPRYSLYAFRYFPTLVAAREWIDFHVAPSPA